ncbi:uncharacterized protein EDB93DRAFT_927980 [Suillus bovinus]|uniref:uncharacterized protein n=1 Tax=Suillus bovinus TaxID=48563 RepID=UPI001B85B3E1|nr:uncharacterized protein EDB93DRAFT_927980 [Suillus bovinus]KAG2156692.1 hypothetical protein EDB93DRAFT_927980 [Suillus bovinus]
MMNEICIDTIECMVGLRSSKKIPVDGQEWSCRVVMEPPLNTISVYITPQPFSSFSSGNQYYHTRDPTFCETNLVTSGGAIVVCLFQFVSTMVERVAWQSKGMSCTSYFMMLIPSSMITWLACVVWSGSILLASQIK